MKHISTTSVTGTWVGVLVLVLAIVLVTGLIARTPREPGITSHPATPSPTLAAEKTGP